MVEVLGGLTVVAGRMVRPLSLWFALELTMGIILVHAPFERTARRVLAECIGLAFLGVPFYAWSLYVPNQGLAEVWSALAFAVSYAAPFFRWLVYHMQTSEEFRR